MKKIISLYNRLCDEYNNKNIQRLCSLQTFLQTKYNWEKNPIKKTLIQDVINYAKTDYPY